MIPELPDDWDDPRVVWDSEIIGPLAPRPAAKIPIIAELGPDGEVRDFSGNPEA